MKRGSIAIRFIAVVLLILVVGQGILWMWFIRGQKTYYAKTAEDKIRTVSNLLANFSVTAILSYNYTSLDQYIEALARDEEIIAIKVLDKKGNVLRERILKVETRGKSINPFYVPWRNTLVQPVKTGAETLGSVEIVYSGQKANDGIFKLITISPLGQLIVFIFVFTAIYLFFRRTIARPVAAIDSVLSRATAGDLTVEMPDIGDDEMGSIAKGVRFLIERLAKMIDRSHSISGNVAMAIEQLTAALTNVSDTTRKQARAVDNVVSAVRSANNTQAKIRENTERLSHASTENVSSLLEMKSTAEEIASSTTRLFKSTEESYAMVAEMSQTAKTIAENTGEAFRAVEDTSASVEEINASLLEVLSNARQSAGISQQLRQLLSEKGTIAIAESIEAMEKIIDEVNRSADIIHRLDERSKNIKKVLMVIKEVTESTNLLSLNAAILAAQAGEYGKSFAVVADEIRALSDRTSASARDITQIVGTIQAEITEAVSAIHAGVERVETGKQLIFKAGEAMGETLEAAQKSSRMAGSIEKAVDEEAVGLRRITTAMENLRRMLEEMVRATEEQKKGSSHMLEGVSDVKEVTEFVKKGTEEHAAGIRLISRNVEASSGMVSDINRASAEQQKTNETVVVTVEQMRQAGALTARELDELTLSFNTLKTEIEFLKREIDVFRTHSVARVAPG